MSNVSNMRSHWRNRLSPGPGGSDEYPESRRLHSQSGSSTQPGPVRDKDPETAGAPDAVLDPKTGRPYLDLQEVLPGLRSVLKE